MNIALLDYHNLGRDLSFKEWESFGRLTVYPNTAPEEVVPRLADCEIAVLNKIKMTREIIFALPRLRLICVTATGYDNVDLAACRERGVALCNVRGYSTTSVAQVTVGSALSLINRLLEYDGYVKSGKYTQSGLQNCLTPVFHEVEGMTWGVVGMGNIGKQVAKVAEAMGCKILCYKKTPDPKLNCTDLTTLFESSDIISVHLPLTPNTEGLISGELISKMKPNAILVNTARGAVTDEQAIATALLEGRMGGFSTDVYSKEPLSPDSPLNKILHLPNVVLTPHMAWGAYEARCRCVSEITLNISAFLKGEERNRLDL